MSTLRSLQQSLAEPRAARAVVLALIGLWTALVLWYIWRVTGDSITRDEWRFVEMLRHWYGGQFSLADIWSTNTAGSEHRVPAFKLYFLADALWFGLDVRLGCYLGALALGVFALLMYRYFLRTRPPGGSAAFDHYAFVPVAITLFSFSQSHIYSYDLLAMFAITGTMLFGALWMQVDLKLRTPQPAWRYLSFAALLVLLLLSFGAGKNPALVLATLVLAVGLALQGGKPVAWKALGTLTAGALLAEFIYFGGGAGSATKGGMSGLLGNVLGDLGGAFHYVLHALGVAFITGGAVLALPEAERAARLDLYGAVVLLGAAAALGLYLWGRAYRRVLLPLVLAVFTAGYLAELVLGRFGGGTDNGSAPRYVYTDHLLVVACVFVFADALTVLHRSGRQRAAIALLVALSLGMGWVEVHNQRLEFRSIDSQAKAQQVAVDAALARLAGQPVAYPRWYCPDQDLCDDDMQFLAEHRLSLARGAPAADSAKP